MTLFTSDGEMSADIGSGSIWYSVYSTAMCKLPDKIKDGIPHALAFLKEGECPAEQVSITKKELDIVISEFSLLKPEDAIYDLHKPEASPPWKGNLAARVTSCANMYTTADGKDLFSEVNKLLSYAEDKKVSISVG